MRINITTTLIPRSKYCVYKNVVCASRSGNPASSAACIVVVVVVVVVVVMAVARPIFNGVLVDIANYPESSCAPACDGHAGPCSDLTLFNFKGVIGDNGF